MRNDVEFWRQAYSGILCEPAKGYDTRKALYPCPWVPPGGPPIRVSLKTGRWHCGSDEGDFIDCMRRIFDAGYPLA